MCSLRGILSGHDVIDLVAFNPFKLLRCFAGGCHSVTHRDEGEREREKERDGRYTFLQWLLLTSSAFTHTHNDTTSQTPHPPTSTHSQTHTSTHSKSQHPHVDRWQNQSDATATPLSNPLTPSVLLPLFLLTTPQSLPHSPLTGPTLFSGLSWRCLTKPSLLPISSETGAGTMTASSPTERGRGKRGPWELQADTLRAVQVSSSSGPAEKRRLICCPCFPREGGCRRKEEGRKRLGVEGATQRVCAKGCPLVFKTDRLISVSSRFLLPMGGKALLSPLVPPSLRAPPILLLQLFGPGNNRESWHHDCKMFQFSFQQAFTSLFVWCLVCVFMDECVCVYLDYNV